MDYRVLQYQKEVLEKGKTKPLNLIHGEEEYLVRSLIDKLRSLYGENLSLLRGEEVDLEELYSFASEGSIFSSTADKAVLLLNFEEFLKKLGKKKKVLESLINFLKSLKSTKLFAVVGRKLTKQELLKEPYRTFSALGDVILADRLSPKKVKEIVRKKLERESGGIEEEALDLLVGICQGDLMVLRQETEKLILYSEGRKVTAEDVRKVCAPWGDYSLFDLVDRFFEGDLEGTLRVVEDLERKGVPALQTIGMLSGYITKLFALKELISKGEVLERALDTLGIKHSFSRLKFKGYLEKMSSERLEKMLETLYRLDYNVKVFFASPEKELRKFLTSSLLK